ncbi:hypothetical protein ACIB24_02495 [Spongisporangium articulatum]|uniref:Uncharacterized protein n=1 Tax=Spongisporangium articulatum TaxID=3362603 RepID=A0ABW8AHT4_9ACTN
MIYEPVDPGEPVRQGDIFVGVPRVEVSLGDLAIFSDAGIEHADWQSLGQDEVQAVVTLRSVNAIVTSQDCDATRANDISFCEIRPFHDVEGDGNAQTDTPKKWVRLITQQARKNQKWFYLPPDPGFKIEERSAADLRVVLSIELEDILRMIPTRRVGRLNEVAASHFRERIAEFYRRYPYDEWYPLNREEFEHYSARMDPAPEAFPWQRLASDAESA